MKVLLVSLLVSSFAMAAPTGAKKTLPVKKHQLAKVPAKDAKGLEKLKEIEKKTEDCDDKAKKPIEIKPEAISLSGGNAGCSVDEAH